MVDTTCATNDLIKMIDLTCDTHNLMVDTKPTKDIIEDSLTSHEMESYSELMKMSHKKKHRVIEAVINVKLNLYWVDDMASL